MIQNAHLMDTPAPISQTAGTTNTAILVRYPDGTEVPIGIPAGVSPRAIWEGIDLLGEDYTLMGVVSS